MSLYTLKCYILVIFTQLATLLVESISCHDLGHPTQFFFLNVWKRDFWSKTIFLKFKTKNFFVLKKG